VQPPLPFAATGVGRGGAAATLVAVAWGRQQAFLSMVHCSEKEHQQWQLDDDKWSCKAVGPLRDEWAELWRFARAVEG